MRRVALCCLVACSVPDKHPSTTDGGVDTMPAEDDGAIPDTMITSAPTAFSNVGPSTFEFTANHANVTFECSIDGESPLPCSSPYTRVLPDASHGFSVRALNKQGKGDDTPAEHLWTIDTVAPITMLTEAPPPADNSVLVRFSFRSNEEYVTFDCSLDGGSYIACTSGSEVGPVGDGSHAFAVRAHDRAGNVDASPAIHAWAVDTSSPDTQLLSGPEGAVGSTSASFTFVSPDAGAGATFQCSRDGGALVACASPYTVNDLARGPHTFQVRVRDAVGNFDPTPATRTWTVDLDPPETTIDAGPMGTVRVASANFTFSSNEIGVTYACSLDGAAFAPCTSPRNLTNLGQGAHVFAVRATDSANHTDETPATRTWTVDTIAPELTITSGPAEGATVGPRVVFAFTANEGVVGCAFDAGVFAACAGSFAANLPAGAHVFRVRATDAAGNLTNVARNFTVACAAPTTAGAAALLHLDDAGQILANAVGGASATLGTNATVEAVDPALGAGRFGGGASFVAAEGDLVAWPVALGATADLTVELWARADAVAGTHDVLVSGDGRLAIRVTAVSPTTVRLAASITGASSAVRTVQSTPVAASAWHHVIVAHSAGTLRLWVDGARTDVAVSGGMATLASIRLGSNYAGALDEVWVAQTAIADNEAALARYCPQ